ncbi:MAG: CPBP family intramembrane glutamic endopeptidase [Candidatus Xenobia bacterium]
MRWLFLHPDGHLRSGWQVVLFVALLLLWGKVSHHLLPGGWRLASQTVSLFVVTAWCTQRFLGSPWWHFGYEPRGGLRFLAGLLISTGMVLAVGALEHVTLRNGEPRPGTLWMLVMLLFAAMREELVTRGFPLQTLARSLPPWLAAICTAVPFALLHIGNPHWNTLAIFNTFLAGLWLAAARLRSGQLWLPTGLHFGWNLALAAFGLTVSGEHFPQLALFSARINAPDWLSGGAYGPEAGLAATVVLILGTLAMWFLIAEREPPQGDEPSLPYA